MGTRAKNGFTKCKECKKNLRTKEDFDLTKSGKTRRKICKSCWSNYDIDKRVNPGSLEAATKKLNKKNPNYNGRITIDPLKGLSKEEIKRRRDKAFAKFCKKNEPTRKLGFGDMFLVNEGYNDEYQMPSSTEGLFN